MARNKDHWGNRGFLFRRYLPRCSVVVSVTTLLLYQLPPYCCISYHLIVVSVTTLLLYQLQLYCCISYYLFVESVTTLLLYQLPPYCCISYHLIEVVDHGVQISTVILPTCQVVQICHILLHRMHSSIVKLFATAL